MLIVYIQTQIGISKLRMVFQNQIPISLVTLVISIQHLYMTKYKYTVSRPSLATIPSQTFAHYSETDVERELVFEYALCLDNMPPQGMDY